MSKLIIVSPFQYVFGFVRFSGPEKVEKSDNIEGFIIIRLVVLFLICVVFLLFGENIPVLSKLAGQPAHPTQRYSIRKAEKVKTIIKTNKLIIVSPFQ